MNTSDIGDKRIHDLNFKDIDENVVVFMKRMKESAAQHCANEGNLPATVMPMRNGHVWAIITAPIADRDVGLEIIKKSVVCFADAFFCCFDARTQAYTPIEGETDEEFHERCKRTQRDRDLQKQVKEGRRGDIVDCLLMFYMDKELNYKIKTVLYEVTEDKKVIWLEREHGEECNATDGFMLRKMKDIMSFHESLFDDELCKKFAEELKLSKPEQIYHAAQGMCKALGLMGCFVSFVGPEYEEFLEEYNAVQNK